MARVTLSHAMVLQAEDLPREFFPIPEWAPKDAAIGDEYGLYLRGLTAKEREDYENSQFKVKREGGKLDTQINLANARMKMLVAACVNEDGSKFFNEADVIRLGDKSGAVVSRIHIRIQELSGITKEAAAILGKDSGSVPTDASSSDSPSLADSPT